MLHCNSSYLQVIFLHLQFHLKVTYYTYFEVHNLFLVTARIGLHSLMFKTHQFSYTFQCFSSVSLLCLRHSVLAPISLTPPSWIPCLVWLVSSHTPDQAPIKKQQSSFAKLIFTCQTSCWKWIIQLCDTMMQCDVTKSLKKKVGLLTSCLQEHCFLWERWAPVGVSLSRSFIMLKQMPPLRHSADIICNIPIQLFINGENNYVQHYTVLLFKSYYRCIHI